MTPLFTIPNKKIFYVSEKTIYAVSKKKFKDNIWIIVNSLYYIVSNVLCCKFMCGSGNKHYFFHVCSIDEFQSCMCMGCD